MSGELLHLTALTAKELRAVTSVTLAHYDQSANSFWQGTRDHDVSQNVEALLRHLRGKDLIPSSISGVVLVAT